MPRIIEHGTHYLSAYASSHPALSETRCSASADPYLTAGPRTSSVTRRTTAMTLASDDQRGRKEVSSANVLTSEAHVTSVRIVACLNAQDAVGWMRLSSSASTFPMANDGIADVVFQCAFTSLWFASSSFGLCPPDLFDFMTTNQDNRTMLRIVTFRSSDIPLNLYAFNPELCALSTKFYCSLSQRKFHNRLKIDHT